MKRRQFLHRVASAVCLSPQVAGAQRTRAAKHQPAPAPGPLRVHSDNPRYFGTPDGKAVYLTGSHTWAGLCERA